MTTPLHDRDAVLAAVDLDSLADHLLGDHRHSPTRTWPCPNPDHPQTGRTPPVTTYRNSRRQQRWHCHGCGADGTAIDLLILTRNHTIRSALDWLATRRPHLAPTPPHRPEPAMSASSRHPDLDDYVTACQDELHSRNGAEALRWLIDTRALSPEVIEAARIGYDPGPRALPRPAGLPCRPGIVLPILDNHDRAVFTQTRLLDDNPGCRYLNAASHLAPNPQAAALWTPHAKPGQVLICEGMIDALTAATAGLEAVAVLSATTPTHRITRHIPPGRHVLVAFDADPAGDHAAQRLLNALTATHPGAQRLRPPAELGDLNAWHTHQSDWTHHLSARTHGTPKRHLSAPTRVLER